MHVEAKIFKKFKILSKNSLNFKAKIAKSE
jgi:hypothetical protein